MNPPLSSDAQSSSTRPYLVRALHDWCTDNGFTPYLAVQVDETVQVPLEYVKNGEIVLNVSFEATSGLKLGNDFVEFKARFGGVPRDIIVPVSHVVAIYARENGQGMAFPAPSPRPERQASTSGATGSSATAATLATDAGEEPPVREAPTPLRLAPRQPAPPARAGRKGPQRVPNDTGSPAEGSPQGPEPPEGPGPGPGPAPAPGRSGRPALKRIK